MKLREIKDIYSKEIGWKPFAKFIDLALAENHNISNIKEYNEKYIFLMDEEKIEFDKYVKDVKGYYRFAIKTLEMIKELKNGTKRIY